MATKAVKNGSESCGYNYWGLMLPPENSSVEAHEVHQIREMKGTGIYSSVPTHHWRRVAWGALTPLRF